MRSSTAARSMATRTGERRRGVSWLGRVPYLEALALQEARVAAVKAGAEPECLLLLEHPPVVTLGRSGDARNLLASERELAAAGIAVHRISRGGDVTYHGPGQLVGYLILDLARRGEPDVGRFLRAIEAALVDAIGRLGLRGHTRAGMTGVFAGAAQAPEPDGVPPRKLASIGVGLRGWITWHGFALNVTTDLAGFGAIVPCGIRGVTMTSLAAELGAAAPPNLEVCAREAVAAAFERRFGLAGLADFPEISP